MTELGVVLLGASLKGSAFAGIGLILALLLRKRGPAVAAMVVFATLVGMAGVTLLGVIPGLRWWSFDSIHSAKVVPIVVEPQSAQQITAVNSLEDSPSREVANSDAPATQGIGSALRDLGHTLLQAPPQPARLGWGWQAWVAVLVMVGIGVGLGRFALGLVAVHLLRRSSRPVEDESIESQASQIQAELGLRGAVAIRVAPGLATPATIGWRRPAILLPPDWGEWDSHERHVVLSHELAHIQRNDYFSGFWAQLSLALHYYHPLAHWLAGRLRLEQELAADAWGARLSGGNRTYLTTLARMALRNDPRPVGWPARSFRPRRGTFLRRIEMLRDTTDLQQPTTLPRRTTAGMIGLLILAGAAIVGLRVPGAATMAQDSPGPKPAKVGGNATLEHGFIPSDIAMIAIIRPSELAAKPEITRFLEGLEPVKRIETLSNLKVSDIEQVTLLWTFSARQPEPALQEPLVPAPAGIIVRMVKPQDWKAIVTKLMPAAKEATFGDMTYYRSEGPGPTSVSSPDGQTLVFAAEPLLFRMLVAKPDATDRSAWSSAFKAVKKGQIAVALDMTALLARIDPRARGNQVAPVSPFGAFAPLVERANAYAIGIDTTRTISIDGIISCNSEEATQQVADTLKASITLGRNALQSFRGKMGPNANDVKLFADFGLPLLEKAAVTSEGRTVHLTTSSDLQLAQAVQILTPSVQSSRETARRVQSINNLKQIGLAFHNYAASNGKFPASANLGPDGKTPHSWRVAILPYIDQNDLYQQYKFDEPWDSPANRKLLDKMPVTYRHPSSKSLTSPSYFVFTGKETLFPGNQGSGIAEIIDGTSYTILAVEAERDIPWTKPEDIPFDMNGPLPKVGGYEEGLFNTLFADGSVRTIKETIRATVFKALITRAGGEVIDSSSF